METNRQNGWNEWSRHVLALLEAHDKKLDEVGNRLTMIRDSQRSDLHDVQTKLSYEIATIQKELIGIRGEVTQHEQDVKRLSETSGSIDNTVDSLVKNVAKLEERMTITWGFVALIIGSLISVAFKVFGG